MGFNDINLQVSGPQQPASTYKTKVLKGQVPFAVQVTEPNTKYVIKHNFVLNGDVTIPENCILEFDGGSVSGEHTITGQNTSIEAGLIKIFNTDVTLAGTWNVSEVYSEWFGAKGDGITDCSAAINATLKFLKPNGGVIKFIQGTYNTSPIDLTGFRNICFEGFNCADSRPWKAQTTIKIIENGIVGIRLVPEYDKEHDAIPNKSLCCAYSTFKNIYLDCNNKVNKGINASWSIAFENCEVRNSLGDGFVVEAEGYPVYFKHVHSAFNKRHGLSILGPHTTSIFIDDIDLSHNEGYGMYIEDGSSCLYKNVYLQENIIGGLKIVLKTSVSDYPYFLSKISFVNLYTEQNGLLEETDSNYDGNYAVKIEGTNTNPQSFVGKIDSIRFYNCTFNNSDKIIDGVHVIGSKLFCEASSNVSLIDCNITDIDYTKNIPPSSQRTVSGGIGFDYRGPYITSYSELKNANNVFALLYGSSAIQLTRNVTLGSVLNNFYNVSVNLRWDSFTGNNNPIKLKLYTKHVDTVYDTFIIGTAIFNYSIVCYVIATASEINFIKTVDGEYLRGTDIESGGNAQIQLSAFMADDVV